MEDLAALLGFGEKGWGGQLLAGTVVTVEIAVASYVVGLLLGLLGAWAKLAGPRPVRALGNAYTTIVRGVPDILIILFVYYGGTSGLRALIGLVVPGVEVEIDAFVAAVASLGFVAGAYATELFRGSILAVPPGQIEAAKSLALRPAVMFFKVVLPQAIRFALPALGNLWVVVLKDSALISVVGMRDLLGIAATAAATTRQPFTFYAVVALIFLALTIVSVGLFQLAERVYGRGYRRS
ncbi:MULTISPECIES: ABC transporter permease [Inquilinus]|uniref:His/Glu/Gln/Arg/opine family amino acid ABC transporter permease subunit n=1 Tax=Inquilinus ginsengisoli TaxID=363840 RepID=A0ABU1JPM2_9PROT|nr:ABC transporter permease subunit [Inquilinus ginsengisoli]MDR6289489.1 His/Glu/Gln/Arg/opine family amino acid ABC transporter permease subunit [Inquilinus ginsengisoli]